MQDSNRLECNTVSLEDSCKGLLCPCLKGYAVQVQSFIGLVKLLDPVD
jgi:hypothetical protein